MQKSSVLCKKNITFLLQLYYKNVTLFAIHYVNLVATHTSVRVSHETIMGSYYVNSLYRFVILKIQTNVLRTNVRVARA